MIAITGGIGTVGSQVVKPLVVAGPPNLAGSTPTSRRKQAARGGVNGLRHRVVRKGRESSPMLSRSTIPASLTLQT